MDLVFSLYSSPKVGHFQGVAGVTALHGLILVIPGAEIRLAPASKFSISASVARRVWTLSSGGVISANLFTSAALGFVFIGLTVSAWLLPRGAAPKPLVIGLPPFLLMPELAERLKYPGLWCLGAAGLELRAKGCVFLLFLAGNPFFSEPKLRHRIVFRPIRFDPEVLLLLSPSPLLLRHYLGGDARLLGASQYPARVILPPCLPLAFGLVSCGDQIDNLSQAGARGLYCWPLSLKDLRNRLADVSCIGIGEDVPSSDELPYNRLW